MIITYALNERPASYVDLMDPFEEMPAEFVDNFKDERVVKVAHNAPFDWGIFQYAKNLKHYADFQSSIDQWMDTQAMAYSHGLPGSLETLGIVLGLPQDQQKLSEDGKLIHTFCIPYDEEEHYVEPWDEPEKWKTFVNYAVRDTEALREIYKRLPRHNYNAEQGLPLWHLDQLSNNRGFQFDIKLATAAQQFLKDAKGVTDKKFSDATSGAVSAATQRQRLLNYLNDKYKLDIANLRAAEVREWLEQDDLNPEVRFLLETRLEAAKSSGAKYGRGLRNVGPRGRMRHTIRFNGAGRTGRFSGKSFQAHNLPRPMLTVVDQDG